VGKKEPLPSANPWVKPEGLVLMKKATEIHKYCIISLICEILKKKI